MTKDPNHQQKVAALRHGTVLDHLNAGTALKALEILGLPEGPALLGINLDSAKMGKKDILKLSGVEITQSDVDRIAIFGPQATVSYIRDYQVWKKVDVQLPETLSGILECPNPNCITNHEPVATRFEVLRPKPLLLRCGYCERRILDNEVRVV